MDKKYTVFISSTYSDLQEERGLIAQSLLEAGYFVLGMESFGASAKPPLNVIEDAITNSDYLVCIVAGRYGGVVPQKDCSFTEYEYDFAQKNGVETFVFLHKNPGAISVAKSESKNSLSERLTDFRRKLETEKTCAYWDNMNALGSSVVAALSKAPKESRLGWIRGGDSDRPQVAVGEATGAAQRLLDDASKELEACRQEIAQLRENQPLFSVARYPNLHPTRIQQAERDLHDIVLRLDEYFDVVEASFQGIVAPLSEDEYRRIVPAIGQLRQIVGELGKIGEFAGM